MRTQVELAHGDTGGGYAVPPRIPLYIYGPCHGRPLTASRIPRRHLCEADTIEQAQCPLSGSDRKRRRRVREPVKLGLMKLIGLGRSFDTDTICPPTATTPRDQPIRLEGRRAW